MVNQGESGISIYQHYHRVVDLHWSGKRHKPRTTPASNDSTRLTPTWYMVGEFQNMPLNRGFTGGCSTHAAQLTMWLENPSNLEPTDV
jgi:hypothetical protein